MTTNFKLDFLFSPFIFIFNLLYLLVGSNMSPVQFIYLLKQTKEQFTLQRVKGGDSISLKKVKLVNKHKATTLHFSFLSSSFLFLIYYLFLFFFCLFDVFFDQLFPNIGRWKRTYKIREQIYL